MPREFSRAERVADALQRELASLVRDELRDPRLGIVNITGVEVSRDLAYAKVFVNFVATKTQDETLAAVEALNGAGGFLRAQLSKSVRMRAIPRLRFVYDESGDRGQHLSALIDYAVSRDKAKHDEDK